MAEYIQGISGFSTVQFKGSNDVRDLPSFGGSSGSSSDSSQEWVGPEEDYLKVRRKAIVPLDPGLSRLVDTDGNYTIKGYLAHSLRKAKAHHFLKKAKLSYNSPTGLLAVHMRSFHLIDFDFYTLFETQTASVYVRVGNNEQVKYTHVFSGVKKSEYFVFDELQHFQIHTSPFRSDSVNNLRVEVVAFNKGEMNGLHKVIAAVDIHLFDIIRKMTDIRRIELRGLHSTQRVIGYLDIEFCFAYGAFGYGYSNQFKEKNIDPNKCLNHSITFCPLPPEERSSALSSVMLPVHVGHPAIIAFKQKALLRHELEEDEAMVKTYKSSFQEQMARRIAEGINKVHEEIEKLNTRKDRVDYLTNLISNTDCTEKLDPTTFRLKPAFILRSHPITVMRKARWVPATTDADTPLITSTEVHKFNAKAIRSPGIVYRRYKRAPPVNEEFSQSDENVAELPLLGQIQERILAQLNRYYLSMATFFRNLSNIITVFIERPDEIDVDRLTEDERDVENMFMVKYEYKKKKPAFHA